jgi:hypothetical protein
MNNTESMATLGTQEKVQRQTMQQNIAQKTKMKSNMDPTKNWG